MKIRNTKTLAEFVNEQKKHNDFLNESLNYHLDNKLSITESIHMIGSEQYSDFVEYMRKLNDNKAITFSKDDTFILERLSTGKKAVFKENGELINVVLDSPEIGDVGKRKYYVFRDSGKKTEDGQIIAFVIGFGDPNSEVKNDDDAARKSFLARHQCDIKDDMNTAGWWSCNVHRFWKQLKLKSDKPW